MRYISKKIIRYAILDAMDRVLRKEANSISKETKMIIYDAAEKISENVQQDYINNAGKESARAPTTASRREARKGRLRRPTKS